MERDFPALFKFNFSQPFKVVGKALSEHGVEKEDDLKYIEKQMRIGAPGWAPAQLVHLLVKKRIFPVEDTEVRSSPGNHRADHHTRPQPHCYGMLARCVSCRVLRATAA